MSERFRQNPDIHTLKRTVKSGDLATLEEMLENLSPSERIIRYQGQRGPHTKAENQALQIKNKHPKKHG